MTTRTNNFTPSLPSSENLRRLAISGNGFVFDPESGHHFTVNETGLLLLHLMQEKPHLDFLLEKLGGEYDVSPRDLERDILEFVAVLRDYIGEPGSGHGGAHDS